MLAKATKYGIPLLLLSIPFYIQVNNLLLIALSVMALIVVSPAQLLQSVRASVTSQLLLAYFLLIAVYALFHPAAGGGRYVEKYLIVPAMILVFPLMQSQHADLRKFILRYINLGFAIACVLCYVLALVRFTESGNANEFVYLKLMAPLKFHALEFSYYLFFLAVYNLTQLREQKVHALYFALFTLTILLLAVRMTILLYVLFLPVVLVQQFGWKKASIATVAFIVIALVAIQQTPELRERFERVLQSKAAPSNNADINGLTGRIVIWKHAVTLLPDHWMLGLSPQGVQEQLNVLYKDDLLANRARRYKYNSHNQYLQTQLGMGIAGLALLLLLYGRTAWLSIKSRDITLMAASFILLLGSITEALLEIHRGLMFALVVALLVEYTWHRKNEKLNA